MRLTWAVEDQLRRFLNQAGLATTLRS
jgi:hypothetical protein